MPDNCATIPKRNGAIIGARGTTSGAECPLAPFSTVSAMLEAEAARVSLPSSVSVIVAPCKANIDGVLARPDRWSRRERQAGQLQLRTTHDSFVCVCVCMYACCTVHACPPVRVVWSVVCPTTALCGVQCCGVKMYAGRGCEYPRTDRSAERRRRRRRRGLGLGLHRHTLYATRRSGAAAGSVQRVLAAQRSQERGNAGDQLLHLNPIPSPPHICL